MRTVSSLALAVALASAETINIPWKVHDENSNWDEDDMHYVEAKAGDTLKFNWEEEDGLHNIVKLKKCDPIGTHDPDSFTCPDEGKYHRSGNKIISFKRGQEWKVPANAKNGDAFCFVCSVQNSEEEEPHCEMGQHSTVVIRQPSTFSIDWKLNMKVRRMKARVGDTFKFKSNQHHNLIRTDCAAPGDGFNCEGEDKETWVWESQGVQEYKIPAVLDEASVELGDRICFYCSIQGHCQNKQYLTVEVTTQEEMDKMAKALHDIKTLCELQIASEKICGACGGKIQGGNNNKRCKINKNKFKKLECSKIEKEAAHEGAAANFCAGIGCTWDADEEKCGGELGENMPEE